jgi:diguanylate cyclase (GGDEF)-like protein
VQKTYSKSYYFYTVLFGLVGFLALLGMTFHPVLPFQFNWLTFTVFTFFAFASKFLSFRLMGLVSLSMDTAVYITALLCIGTIPAGWAVFFSCYAKVVWDMLEREFYSQSDFRPFLENISAPLFQGGSGVAALMAAGLLLPVEAFVAGDMDRTLNVLWLAPASAAIFVVFQYTSVLHKYFLLGFSWPKLFREVLVPGLIAELVLMPLALAMALIFHGQGGAGLPFFILLATYLVVNFIFKKLSDARTRLDERVQDLQSLNTLGRTICSSLQTDDLVHLLTSQTLAVVEEADSVMVRVWDDDRSEFEVYVQHESDSLPPGFEESLLESLADRTIRSGRPFSTAPLGALMGGVQVSEIGGRRLDTGSYMGIPVQVYEQTIGSIVLYSAQRHAFSPARMGLLQMIGQQAAVALQNSRLYVLATVDGLTKLFVRRYFDRRLAEEVARSKRYGTSFALMLLDFDGFKEINDNFGHSAGDMVLRTVASTVLAEVRTIDIPSRFGGDEFAVILPEVDSEGSRQLAQRIVNRVKREKIRSGDHLISTSLSVGIAAFPEHAQTDTAQLLTAADKALYQVKHSGKGTVRVSGDP